MSAAEMADVSTTTAFLRWVHAPAIEDGVAGRVVISVKQPIGAKRKYESATWTVAEIDVAAKHAAEQSDLRRNVYCRVHLVNRVIPVWQRGTHADTRWVTHLAGDVDIAGPGHSSTNLPPDLDAAVALIDATLPPSLIVSSGGGLYPIWRLSHVVKIDGPHDEERLRNVGRRLDLALASHGWHVDATVLDLARIIRPPGVWNHKPGRDARQVTVLRGWHDGAGDYDLEALERLLPPLPDPPAVRPRPQSHWPTDTSGRPPWEVFAERFTLEDVLAADDRHDWERVDDQGGMPAWRRVGSESDYSVKLSPSGVVIVWSGTVAGELRIEPGTGLDLWGFACRLAELDPTEAARGRR